MIDTAALWLIQLSHFAQTGAVNCEPNTTCDTGLPKVTATSGAISSILQVVFGVLGAIAVLIIVIAGLRFITAQGDPQGVAKARSAILYAAIGLIVALSAEVIVTFVLKNL
jgi:hypothetical protein